MLRKPKVTVFGLGKYYRKLRSAIWQYFDPIALFDTRSGTDLDLEGYERAVTRQILADARVNAIVPSESAATLVLTPNDVHARMAADLLQAGQLVFLEKPHGVTSDDLTLLRNLIGNYRGLYLSDYYVDTRSLPLFAVFGVLHDTPWAREMFESQFLAQSAEKLLGTVVSVEAYIRESDPLDQRPWLAGSGHGGVTFDLLYHLLCILRRLFPRVELHISEVHSDLSPSQERDQRAESYVECVGRLSTNVDVRLIAQKGSQTVAKSFRIIGTAGIAEMQYSPDHVLTVEGQAQSLRSRLPGDYHELIVWAFSEWIRCHRESYGAEWALWALEKSLQIRQLISRADAVHRMERN